MTKSFDVSQLTSPTGSSLVGYTPQSTTRTVDGKLDELPSVKDFGAVGDGVTDDTAALQAALDSNQVVFIPPGKYRTTSTLLVDPVRNRGNGFIGSLATRYPYTTQVGGPTWNGTKEAVIFYDGATSTTAAVIAASSSAVGVEPSNSFDKTIWTFTLQDVTLDANGKAGFGFYEARIQDLQLRHMRARGATVAGISINGTYSGSIESVRCYLNPGRGFELGDADRRWGWVAQDKINALYIRDLHCDANGSASEFRESDPVLRTFSCGVFFGPHRGVRVTGIVSENNFGANIVFAPSDKGNSISGIYTELGCKYAPGGAGTDAISLGFATQQWGVIFVGLAAATHNRIVDGVIATDRVWLTGTEPTATREEGGLELYNLSLATGLHADWGNYRLVNCALEFETIVGTAPVGAFTIRGGLQFGVGKNNLTVYEEGTWTPAFAGATVAGTGWTHSLQAGSYTRIGRHVFFTGRVTLSAVSGDATGQMAITGLPFTVQNSNNANSAVTISNASNMGVSVVAVEGSVGLNTTRFTLQKRTAAATSPTSVVLTDLSATTTITFSGHYVAA